MTTELVPAHDPKALVKIFGFLRKDTHTPPTMTEMKDFWQACTIEEKARFSLEVDLLQTA